MKLFLCAFVLVFLGSFVAHADDVLCISSKTGRLLLRVSKCKKGETLASVATLAEALKNSKLIVGETGPAGPKGETGLAGPKGDNGLQGPQGNSGVLNRQIVTSNLTATITSASTESVVAGCPLPKVALGGSCTSSNFNVVIQSNTIADGFGSIYGCVYKNISGSSVSNVTLTASVVCASFS